MHSAWIRLSPTCRQISRTSFSTARGIPKSRCGSPPSTAQAPTACVLRELSPPCCAATMKPAVKRPRPCMNNLCGRNPAGPARGKRLKPEALAVTVGGINLANLSMMNLTETQRFLESLRLGETHTIIADQIIKEIRARLSFLRDVGLDYLSLSRAAATLLSAVSPSESALRRRLVPAWSGYCISWMSPPLACTRRTTHVSLARSNACATWATP